MSWLVAFLPAREENHDWWKKRVGFLKTIAIKSANVDKEVVYSKNGLWPLIKLVNVDFALGFYLPIMNSQRSQGNWSELHYIDLMAGNGLTRVVGERSGSHLVAGTSLIGANCHSKNAGKAFDHYHFVEEHEPWARTLEARLGKILPPDSFTVYSEAPAVAVPKIVSRLGGTSATRKAHFFALVDPEGLTEITLPDLVPLFQFGRGDFLFNFQFTGPKRAPECASKFFGDEDWPTNGTWEDIREFFWGKLAEHGRPRGESFRIDAGAGHGPYAYEMYYCAAKTASNNQWLKNFGTEFERRKQGIDGTRLDQLLANRSLGSFA